MLNLVANGPSGYTISNSLRIRSSASASLTRTPASNGNRQIFTISTWFKRGALSTQQAIITQGTGNRDIIRIGPDNLLYFYYYDGTTYQTTNTNQVFRDPSAWYHIIYAIDTTQATAANRIKLYINGSQVTSFANASYPAQNYSFNYWNTTNPAAIGKDVTANNDYLDGYLAEYNFIDGQALTPSSFGSTNATTGVWQPAKYTGTYGTNGFYLKFSDIAQTVSSNVGLGKDFSTNTNYWVTNNISTTAGTTYDAMTDVPTNTSATVANYCVVNPLINTAGYITYSNANLTATGAAADKIALSTMSIPLTGKYYYEYTVTTVGLASTVGIADAAVSQSSGTSFSGANGRAYQANGQKSNLVTASAYGSSFTTGDIIGIAIDMGAGTIVFYKNNTSQGTAYSDLAGGTWFPAVYLNSAVGNFNFGQRPFTYTPPTGYVALNTYNLPDSTIPQGNKYMDATTYTGTASGVQTITNAGGFKPDLVWNKIRNAVGDNVLVDSVRGVANYLVSNTTAAEASASQFVTSFNSNGFSTGTSGYISSQTVVGWQWQAGQGSSSSNTNGSITSTVSVNASAGFSIVTYTGTGANATVGHGLGVAPKMVIIKTRNSASWLWVVYHASVGNTGYLRLQATDATTTSSAVWQNTTPSSSVVTIGTDGALNTNTNTYVMYAWAEIAGFSKAFSYTGNGSADGPMVYLGFRPKFVVWKRTDTTGSWNIIDSSRDTYNVSGNFLYPNLSNAEGAGTYGDLLSNGFKIRIGTDATTNASGGTYIGMAWAENPFKNSLAR